MKKSLLVFMSMLFLSITACSVTTPSEYYVLSPISDASTASFPDVDKIQVIGVGPITFPKYLNRSQLVRFSGDNEVVVDEFNRWAEPIDQNFTRVLRTNITRLLPTSYAISYPWKRAMNVRFQVILDIHQFEMNFSGSVNLKTHWAIFNIENDKKLVVAHKFSYSKKIDEINYAKIVAEQSKALEALSRDIATEMQKLMDR